MHAFFYNIHDFVLRQFGLQRCTMKITFCCQGAVWPACTFVLVFGLSGTVGVVERSGETVLQFAMTCHLLIVETKCTWSVTVLFWTCHLRGSYGFASFLPASTHPLRAAVTKALGAELLPAQLKICASSLWLWTSWWSSLQSWSPSRWA